MNKILIGGLIGAALMASSCSNLQTPPVDRVVYLDQGWTEEIRDEYHFTSQGTSTIPIPFTWFMALEQPELSFWGPPGMISDPDYMSKFGFFGMERTPANESGLPIGFAVDYDFNNPTTGESYPALGFTCAACHTGQLIFNNTAIRVDGGSTNANIVTVVERIMESLEMTNLVPGRFSRFAARVLREENTESNREELKEAMKQTMENFAKTTILSAVEHSGSVHNGFGRVDALNLIGNQVFGTDAQRPENYAALTAPVNFPMIWLSSWFRWVQYDGSIMQVMIRNTGEALGVVAPVNLTAHGPPDKYSTSARIESLHWMEEALAGDTPPRNMDNYKGLRWPRWPEEILGDIEQAKAKEGEALYSEYCVKCHGYPVGSEGFAKAPNWETSTENPKYQFYRNMLVSLETIGTDPGQTSILPARSVNTEGVLPEVKNLCVCSTEGDVSYEYTCETDKNGNYDFTYEPGSKALFATSLGVAVTLTVDKWFTDNNFSSSQQREYSAYSPNCYRVQKAYRTRPLNGVWATPPFLHNGSVPTIYDLLSPVDERPSKFYTGSYLYDPVRLGYESDGGGGSEKFDATKNGNLNTGHEFNDGSGSGIIGPKLTEGEKMALIEYLKTL